MSKFDYKPNKYHFGIRGNSLMVWGGHAHWVEIAKIEDGMMRSARTLIHYANTAEDIEFAMDQYFAYPVGEYLEDVEDIDESIDDDQPEA